MGGLWEWDDYFAELTLTFEEGRYVFSCVVYSENEAYLNSADGQGYKIQMIRLPGR